MRGEEKRTRQMEISKEIAEVSERIANRRERWKEIGWAKVARENADDRDTQRELADEFGTLSIGDRNRAGTLEITDTAWDHNGTLRVTVRELIGTGCWIGGVPVEKMRRLARRALMYPGTTITGSRVIRQWDAQGSTHITFAVTRLPRS